MSEESEGIIDRKADSRESGHWEYEHCNWYWVPDGEEEDEQ